MTKFKKSRIHEINLRPKFDFKRKFKKAYLFFLSGLFLGGSFVLGGYANNIGVAYKKIELKGSQAMLKSAIREELEAKAIYHNKLEIRERKQANFNKIKCEIATMNAKISISKEEAISHEDISNSLLCTKQPVFFKNLK